jgi:hypothetical protein
MFLNNLLNFLLTLVIQVTFLLVLYALLRVLLRQELGWKLIYATSCFILTFLIAAVGSPSLLHYLLRGSGNVEEHFVVRDGNSFVVLLMELSLFSAFLITFPLVVFYFWTYISASLTSYEHKALYYFLYLFFYLYGVVFFIVDQDLSLTAWDSILATEVLPVAVQVQPDLDFLFFSYRGEWVDFFVFVCVELLLFFLFYQGYFSQVWRNTTFHFGFLGFHLISIFYFFGGEGWLFDVSLLAFSFVLFELIYLQMRILFFLKLKVSTSKLN